MQIILAIALAIIAYLLFTSKFDNKVLERAANVSGIVATAAAIIVLAFYTFPVGTQQEMQSTATAQENATSVITNTLTPLPIQSNTSIPSPSETLIPTDTPSLPTAILTATISPTPSMTLPFRDDFSSGVNPPWSIYSGNWMTTEDGATITINQNDNYTGALVIDEPTLTNYRLRVDVYSPNVLAAYQGVLGVVVRYGADRDQNLIYYMNKASRFLWGYTTTLSESRFNLTPVTGNMKADFISRFTLEIDVSGNTFTAKVNGAKYDQFTLSGYETGGIALVTSCGAVGSCPAFSNFSLEPLP